MPDADLTERIARAILAHYRSTWHDGGGDRTPGYYCTCGERIQAAHTTHQAEAVAAVVQDEVAAAHAYPDVDAQTAAAATARALVAEAEVERLRAGITQEERRVSVYGGTLGTAANLRALLEPPRPRITTTWGEPDGIGGPRKPHVGRTETWDLDGKVS